MTAPPDAPLHTHALEVRWGDMDALGHVNNTRYFVYCESARMAFFEAIDLDSFCATPTVGVSLVTASCTFKQQLHYPAQLEVDVRCSRVGGKSFTLTYTLRRRGEAAHVATGESVVVWTDYATSKALPLPDGLRALLERSLP